MPHEAKPIGFQITNAKGFHITFENGWTISVQWGYGNYGDNYSRHWPERTSRKFDDDLQSSEAEIAAWDAKGKWYEFGENGDVLGYQTPAQVLETMNTIAGLPKCE